jgi:hypothetical protein
MATQLESNIGDSVPVPHFSSDQWELAWTSLMKTQSNLSSDPYLRKCKIALQKNSDKPAAHSRQTMKQISHLIAAEPSFDKTSIRGQKP